MTVAEVYETGIYTRGPTLHNSTLTEQLLSTRQ